MGKQKDQEHTREIDLPNGTFRFDKDDGDMLEFLSGEQKSWHSFRRSLSRLFTALAFMLISLAIMIIVLVILAIIHPSVRDALLSNYVIIATGVVAFIGALSKKRIKNWLEKVLPFSNS